MLRFLLLAFALVAGQCAASIAYRFAAIKDGNVCLIGSDNNTALVLAKGTDDFGWEAMTLSPSGTGVVASGWRIDTDSQPVSSEAYRIEFTTGDVSRLGGSVDGLFIPDKPMWLDDSVVVLERWGEEGEGGMYAVDVKTGTARRIVDPNETDFSYMEAFASPSKKLITTNLGITMGSWLSVSNLSTGKLYWRTNPEQGFTGMTAVTWFSDSKSLLVSFSRDPEWSEDPDPQGVWQYDAFTGKRKLWEYGGHDIYGIWASPDYKMLAVGSGQNLEFISLPGWKRLFSVKVRQPEGWMHGEFYGDKRFLLYGEYDSYSSVMDIKARQARTYPAGMHHASFSPDGRSVVYLNGHITTTARILDLRTGHITRIPGFLEAIAWLPRDIVR